MTSEEKFRWTALIAASFIVHAVALAWLDFSGTEAGRLPSKLTVLLKSISDGEATGSAKAPASAVRSRDLFDHPTRPDSEPGRLTEAERKPALERAAAAPRRMIVEKTTEPDARADEKMPARVTKTEKTPASATKTAVTPRAPQVPAAASREAPTETIDRAERFDMAAAASEPAPARSGPSASAAEFQGQLLSLLHQAISREQRYPLLAKRQRREGTATVSFSLSPSGEMDAIGIDRSSGFSALDTAAVSAVSRVAPFAPARLYLSDVTRFKVNVTFKLN